MNIEDLKLIPTTDEHDHRSVTYGRRRRKTRNLAAYDVFDSTGARIGKVYEGMATFETRSRGRRYVNTRWSSPRWYYAVPGVHRRSGEYETRKMALACLLQALTTDVD